jgi:two-component system, response regulator YesN
VYKVLFADDEPIALTGIAMLADWDKLGFTICGLCSNGEEALAGAVSNLPDLIITDIRMPGLDGLELIEQIKQRLEPEYDPVFIIMSGYNDFQYARTALRCGVKHYLLKPVLEADWNPVLADILEELQAKRLEKERRIWSQSRLLEAALTRRLQGEELEMDEEMDRQLEELDQESSGWRYVHIEGGAGEAAAAASRVKLSYPEVIVLSGSHGQTGLAVKLSLDVAGIARSLWQECLAAGVEASVSVGPSVRSLRDLSVSYSGAVEAASHHFFDAAQGPVEYISGVHSELSYNLKAMKTVEQLLTAAEKLQGDEAGDLISSLFRLFRDELTAPEVIQTVCLYIVLKTIDTLREMGDGPEMRTKFSSFLSIAPKCMPDLEQSLRSYMADYINRLRYHKESVCAHPLQAVKRYVCDNYKKPLTIKEIGARFFLNPVYLGSAFSHKYGISIIEYIHDLRIQEAKRLLLESGQSVRSIAEQVGYVQYNHFLTEFRKRVAEKPNVYRLITKA